MIDLGSKYIYAQQTETAFNHPVYEIVNKASKAVVAQIGWYPRWKRYVLYPSENSVFDLDCLPVIVKFMESLKPEAL